MVEVLEHIEDIDGFLEKVYQVAEENSIVIITVPQGKSIHELLMAIVRYLKRIKFFAWIIKKYRNFIKRGEEYNESPHVQMYSVKSLSSILERNGFEILEAEKAGIFSLLFWTFVPFIKIPFLIKRLENKVSPFFNKFYCEQLLFVCKKG